MAGLGAAREYATEGGGGAHHMGEVLSRVSTGGADVWGRNMGVVGANGVEARGNSCGVPEIGGEVKGKEAEELFVAEGGGEQSTSGSGDTTTPDLIGQETGKSGGMGGPTAHI